MNPPPLSLSLTLLHLLPLMSSTFSPLISSHSPCYHFTLLPILLLHPLFSFSFIFLLATSFPLFSLLFLSLLSIPLTSPTYSPIIFLRFPHFPYFTLLHFTSHLPYFPSAHFHSLPDYLFPSFLLPSLIPLPSLPFLLSPTACPFISFTSPLIPLTFSPLVFPRVPYFFYYFLSLPYFSFHLTFHTFPSSAPLIFRTHFLIISPHLPYFTFPHHHPYLLSPLFPTLEKVGRTDGWTILNSI